MCFDHDSRPPVAPDPTGMRDAQDVVLEAADGNRFSAFVARAARPTGTGIVILPDVRGLDAYYHELTERFAEHGVDAIAIDYFGRTAGTTERGPSFEHMPHAQATTYDGLSADIRAGAAHLRSVTGVKHLFTIGFCMGGRLSFDNAALADLELAGVIGFYGFPTGATRNGTPPPAEIAGSFTCPVLGIFGGADEAITASATAAFDEALTAAGIDHRISTYEGAPHSFFDRKAADHAEASQRAWVETLAFMGVDA